MSDWQLFLLIFVALLLYYRPGKAKQSGAPAERTTDRPTRPAAGSHHWPSRGEFDFVVVGESFHQDALAQLARNDTHDAWESEVVAELVPESDNKHDPQAVAVRIQGRLVGHLSRQDARSFRRRLSQKGLAGATTTCDAVIAGGRKSRGGDVAPYGVRLDIKSFE